MSATTSRSERPPGPPAGGPRGGPMGMGLGMPGQKSMDFRGSLRRLLTVLRPERVRLVAVLVLGALSVAAAVASVVDLYRRAWAFCDETIDTLPLSAVGRVPWWRSREVTLFRIIVHVTDETARHAGHADILRELTDRSVGLYADNTNIPDWQGDQMAAYVDKLKNLAEGAGN